MKGPLQHRQLLVGNVPFTVQNKEPAPAEGHPPFLCFPPELHLKALSPVSSSLIFEHFDVAKHP